MKRLFSGLLALLLCLNFICAMPIRAEAASYTGKYWIKVNKQTNVATIYEKQDGEWTPVKAMVTSCGGDNTKTGTFYTSDKYRWHELIGSCYGQYCTRIVDGILFHSVWYYENGNKKSQSVKEFNKLGKTASHGCVRLSTADAKWIYDNCAKGTKVTIYSDSETGPLGKPAAYKMPSEPARNWDPTDPDSQNPYYKTLPVLTQKVKNVQYGASKTTTQLVTAKQRDGSALKKLSAEVKKWDASSETYVSAKWDTTQIGTYRITYTAVSERDVSITKTFQFRVLDTRNPQIKASNRTVALNTVSAVAGMKASLQSGTDCTKSVKVSIKEPGAESYGKALSYNAAKEYQFAKTGTYRVKYTVSNPYKKSSKTTKTIRVTVREAADSQS